MASELSDEEVRRIADLARLDVSPDEIPRFAQQLTAILRYAELVQQVDTTGVTPTEGVATAGFRDDSPTASLDRTTVLEQAPAAAIEAGLFRVPKVL
jgi:aspartyl-tRNA(Asn)/glutamyl-tRNA(Gln) amidotransferase subunit C